MVRYLNPKFRAFAPGSPKAANPEKALHFDREGMGAQQLLKKSDFFLISAWIDNKPSIQILLIFFCLLFFGNLRITMSPESVFRYLRELNKRSNSDRDVISLIFTYFLYIYLF